MVNDVLREIEAKMKKSVDALRQHLTTVRTGRASPALVEHMQVGAYGSPMPMNQLAGISTPDARMIVIQPYDASMIKAIEKAILASDLGLTPSNDGNVIRIPLPALTEERRKELVKVIHKFAEEGRVAIRHARTEAITRIKKAEHVSEDEKKHTEKDVQKLHDEHSRLVDEAVKAKSAEIMEV